MSESPAVDPYGSEAPLVDMADFPSWILLEDEHLLVINKPGWLVCHPSKNGPFSSLVGAAREWCGVDRLHLVSRLDRETSGLVVLAKNALWARELQVALAQRRVSKCYRAILQGEMSEKQVVDAGLASDRNSEIVVRQKVTFGRIGKSAVTEFHPLRVCNGHTLVEVVPVSGRKHQIRAHAEWLGHCVVADKLYGPDEQLYLEFVNHGWTERHGELLPMRRQALHALSMTFDLKAGPLTFTAPVPADMRDCWKQLTGENWPEGLGRGSLA
ncbi:MAG: RluA family pseudouridine synthase [Opitutales bacterium]|nr:RluA family pseudouridine synthase [Opitutales bacterium]